MSKKRITDKEHYQKRNPWVVSLYAARQRCSNPNAESYKNYGGRGIKCLLSALDAHFLWIRDGAGKMGSPSLDRIDPDLDYSLTNCRFVELSENAKRRRNTRTGCSVCGPDARHFTAGLCAHHFNTTMRKRVPETPEQKEVRRVRDAIRASRKSKEKK